jgi:hypothetical protein
MSSTKVAPRPGPSLRAVRLPPISVAALAHECSPNPCPVGLVVKPWRKSCEPVVSSKPWPSSLTASVRRSPERSIAHLDATGLATGFGHGFAGVLEQVDEHLHEAVAVDEHAAELGNRALEHRCDARAEPTRDEAPGELDLRRDLDRFEQLVVARELLLRLHELGDVLDTFLQRARFVPEFFVLLPQGFRDVEQERRDVLALGIGGHEAPEVLTLVAHEFGQLEQLGQARPLQAVRDLPRRHVDAVQHVADVVQDPGGDLAHAGGARGVDELRPRCLELAHHALELARQDAELVITRQRDLAAVVVRAADLDGVRREPRDRVDHGAPQHGEQDEEQEQPGRDRGDERVAQGIRTAG